MHDLNIEVSVQSCLSIVDCCLKEKNKGDELIIFNMGFTLSCLSMVDCCLKKKKEKKERG